MQVKPEKVKPEPVKKEKVKPEPAKKPTVEERRDAFFAAQQPSSEDREDEPTGDEGEGDEEEPFDRTAWHWSRQSRPVFRHVGPPAAPEQPWTLNTPKCGGRAGILHKCRGEGCQNKTRCNEKPCGFERRGRVCQGCDEKSDDYSDDLP
jgi:hypothetical protein